MTLYPDEQKVGLIERMLPPDQANVPRLAKETGIPRDTLYGWRRQALRARGLSTAPATGGGERWSSAEKFAMVIKPDFRNSTSILPNLRHFQATHLRRDHSTLGAPSSPPA